jgi:hypothetical protein
LKRAVLLALLLSGCGANCGNFTSSSNLCTMENGVGPDGTDGYCGLGAVCLPPALAPCTGNLCCHNFCSVEGCPPDASCVSLSPDQFPDGGPAGCECVDGGECTCSARDGGICLRPSCLQVCSSET